MIVGLHPAEAHQLVVRDAQGVPHRAEVLLHQARVEPVMAGRHGRVGREHRLPGHPPDRVVVGIPVPLHPAPHGLERGEGGMAFVQVVDAGHDPQGTDRLHAADPQDDLLPDPGAGVTAVQSARQRPVLRGVFRNVGVEQVEAAAADRQLPDLGEQGPAPGVDTDHDRLAVGADRRLDRQQIDLGRLVLLVLVAVDVEMLAEVALRVEQADGDQGDAEAAGALHVVAGQHTEAAGIDRHRLVDPELRREVDDRL